MAKKTYSKKYKVAEEIVPGVTTIIKTSLGWGMHALIAWNVKMVKEGKDPKEAMQSAADAGTLAHTLIEIWCKAQLGQPVEGSAEEACQGYTPEQVKAAMKAVDSFHMWRENNGLTLVASEHESINKFHKYGGTIDLIFKDKLGSIHIVDLKTTNYLLPDHLIQIAAYVESYELENELAVRAGHMLRLGKGDMTVFHHTSWDREAIAVGFKAFKNLLELYHLKKRIESLC